MSDKPKVEHPAELPHVFVVMDLTGGEVVPRLAFNEWERARDYACVIASHFYGKQGYKRACNLVVRHHETRVVSGMDIPISWDFYTSPVAKDDSQRGHYPETATAQIKIIPCTESIAEKQERADIVARFVEANNV